MKHFGKKAAVLLVCTGLLIGGVLAAGLGGEDSVITLSYLEKKMEGVAGYECITLKKGETLFLVQGAQVVLYTGAASIEGSLIDTTEGSLASQGSRAQKYHTYLVPADESGFTAEGTCVIFLSGEKI